MMLSTHFIKTVNNYDSEIKGVIQLKQAISVSTVTEFMSLRGAVEENAVIFICSLYIDIKYTNIYRIIDTPLCVCVYIYIYIKKLVQIGEADPR